MLETAHILLPVLSRYSDLVSPEDFDLIRAIESETDHLPIGRVRQLWHPDSLQEKDREIARCESFWHEQMKSTCRRVRRALLLRKLVVNRHLNVAERALVVPVQRKEVATIVSSILHASSVFPEEGREGVAYEGTTIVRTTSGVQIVLSHSHPIHPRIIVERRVMRYGSLDEAIEAFIDYEWSKGIDGILLDSAS